MFTVRTSLLCLSQALKANMMQERTTSACLVYRNSHKLASIQEISKLSEKKLNSIIFPFKDLERYLAKNVNKMNFQMFAPSFEDIGNAERFFTPSSKHYIDYFTSAVRIDHAPATAQPEGHTKKMNFFKVGKAFTVVDMPGYGYRAPSDFVEMVEIYLQARQNLKRTFLLLDGSIGIQVADQIAIEMCEEFGIPYVLVLTKIDRPQQGNLLKIILGVQEVIEKQTLRCFPQLFLVSSLNYSGIHLLRCFIAHVTGNLQINEHNSISSSS
uniref:GTP-binding protein 8 isoform X2 n=1 Tax=Pristiophorus japonicus TaxID=55135 RepID=UPI00398F13CF